MGTFFVETLLAAPERPERRQPVELLVNSGSTYTWVTAALLRELSIVPTERRRVVTIEGQVVERDAAEVLITLAGRTLHTVCLFAGGGDLDVLGAYTLEGFGLGVDPVQRKLIPTLQYGAAAESYSRTA
jgi:predicted aspartyl protease